MRIAYADPPYPGMAKKHYADHPDYAGEVDHARLVDDLLGYDGWAISSHVAGTFLIGSLLSERGLTVNEDYRLGVWVKPFAAYKRNVKWAYTWEPLFVKAARPPEPNRIPGIVSRDHIAEGITMKKGLAGAKPERFGWWFFEALGLDPDDEFTDLFPGTGAVTDAHETWKRQIAQSRMELAA
jgi:hypothetical protein